jgi:hypothetical protein
MKLLKLQNCDEKNDMMRIVISLVFLLSVQLQAQDGKYAADFIDQGIGVRALSLGQAYSAAAEDLSAIHYNPAGLSLIGQSSVYLQYTDLYEGLAYQHFVGYSHPLFGGWAIAGGWMRVGVDDLQRSAQEISPVILENLIRENSSLEYLISGTFSNANDVYYLSIAKNNALLIDLGWQYFEMPLEIPVGLTFKYINQSIDGFTGSGVGVDIGTMLRFGLTDLTAIPGLGTFAYSLTLKDAFETKVTWDTESAAEDVIPLHFYHGLRYTQGLAFMDSQIMLLYMYDSQYGSLNNIGFEFDYDNLLAFRLGLRDDNLDFGAVIKFWLAQIDYDLLPHELGSSHRLSLSVGL